jgi:Rrf2 family protein
MKSDSRLSVTLHVLLHMAERGKPMTSAELAAHMDTNPVVVRRTFAGLREVGIVSSQKGHGGGWRLARPPAEVTLDQVQRALGERLVAVATPDESPGCAVEAAVHRALDDAVAEANAALDRRLAAVTLADLARSVGPQYRAWHSGRCERNLDHGV